MNPAKALHDLMLKVIHTPVDPDAPPLTAESLREIRQQIKMQDAMQCPSLFGVPGYGVRRCNRSAEHEGDCRTIVAGAPKE